MGPDSAGADPGPAAYQKGGELPTVTDANVVLGYLPAQQRLGGEMEISLQKAEQAVQTIADAMGLTLKQAAEGIVKIVNENMFGALRLVSMASTRPSSDSVLIENPSSGNTAKVPIRATGTAKVGMSVARKFCRKMKTTNMTRTIA